MKKRSINHQAFFALLRAGLWEQDALLSQFAGFDYSAIFALAKEQTVIGLVLAGIEHVTDAMHPEEEVLVRFIGPSLRMERGNKSLNRYVARLIERLRRDSINAILVKGQGIAQCYEKPLWRSFGDIDLLLSDLDYEKAKQVLLPSALKVTEENKALKHIGIKMRPGLVVELHGTLHTRLSRRVDNLVDEVQRDVLGGNVRQWNQGDTDVLLPSADNDVILVFTHILHHYFLEGIGLRQICDWCRLLWTYRESLNRELLETRIRRAGLMSEWKAFAALAVEWLGMPAEAMPLYSPDKKWSGKAVHIMDFVLECGNFGQNRPSKGKKKVRSAWLKTKDFANHLIVFPFDSIKFFFHFLVDGIKLAL